MRACRRAAGVQRVVYLAWHKAKECCEVVVDSASHAVSRSAGALDTLDVLRGEMAGRGIDCRFVEVGCLGPCYAEPLVTVALPGQPTVCFAWSHTSVMPVKSSSGVTR